MDPNGRDPLWETETISTPGSPGLGPHGQDPLAQTSAGPRDPSTGGTRWAGSCGRDPTGGGLWARP